MKIAWAVCSEEWRCRSEKEENEEGGEMGWGREGEGRKGEGKEGEGMRGRQGREERGRGEDNV